MLDSLGRFPIPRVQTIRKAVQETAMAKHQFSEADTNP